MSTATTPTKIITIDCEYVKPRFAAAYLLINQGEAAFVDNNTAHSVPKLLQALAAEGLKPEDVRYIIITHVHLDHAGGTSALAQACPSAEILAHPRAARHVIDPSRLVASATRVYGAEVFQQLYGQIDPVPKERVREMQDGEKIAFGGTSLEFLHTRGHANHHFCVKDEGARAIFTGDSFGLRYPDLQQGGLFIFPTTSPTDFDPQAASESVRRIAGSGAQVAYPTHFGAVEKIDEAATQLLEHLEFSGELLQQAIDAPPTEAEDLEKFCRQRLDAYYAPKLKERGLNHRDAWELIEMDLELNAAGIAFVAKKERACR